MSNNVKELNMKNGAYNFFSDIIYIENCDPNNIKVDKKSYKNILIYYIGYETLEKDLKIFTLNLCTLFWVKRMDTFNRLMEKSI